jgi:GNAT superfamily N-acetyltransferase
MGCVVSDQVKTVFGDIRFPQKKFPALLLARMATQDGLRGQGIGKEMLAQVFKIAFALCPHVGCRFIRVDAKNNPRTIHFYEIYGQFKIITENSSDGTVQMLVDLNKICFDETSSARLSDFD